MKHCPYCNWEVSETVKKCKHCWEFINGKNNAEIKNIDSDKVNYELSNKTRNGVIISLLVVVIIVVIAFIILWKRITALEKDEKYSYFEALQMDVYDVEYRWKSGTNNNLKWIWDMSLWFPEYLKWKECYILWHRLVWADWWTVRWTLWKNCNSDKSFEEAENYFATINNDEETFEIIKWNRGTAEKVMLTGGERDNLCLQATLLCKKKFIF